VGLTRIWRHRDHHPNRHRSLCGAPARPPELFPKGVRAYWKNTSFDRLDNASRTAWIRGFAAAIEPHASGGQYVNFLGQEGGRDRTQAALAVYGPAKLQRLVALKRRYDPDNILRLNHNIPPG
jgi:FAD/FMN-containing dehydrogenase